MSESEHPQSTVVEHARNADLRLYERNAYAAWHRLAYHDGKLRPGDTEYAEVETYDFSPDGFSFWSLDAPTTDFIVVELGSSARRVYAKAQVKHVTHQDHNGAPMVLVGCKFRGRY